MRYERLKDIVKLAIRMQGLRGGVTLDEIQAEFAVGRRTAERMRDAVEWAFGPLEIADGGDNKRHWRLRSDALRRLAPLSAEELAELESAAETLERTGFEARAAALRELDTKLRAAQRTDSLARIEADIEALVQAEGLAMRPGPRPSLDRDLLARPARGHHHLPHRRGPLPVAVHGPAEPPAHRALRPALRQPRLPGGTDGLEEQEHAAVAPRQHERGARDRRELHRATPTSIWKPTPGAPSAPSRRSRWTWCCASRPRRSGTPPRFLFHPSQTMEENADGTLTVRFTAGGIDEMCWHLVTWGESVTVEEPDRTPQSPCRHVRSLAAHHENSE